MPYLDLCSSAICFSHCIWLVTMCAHTKSPTAAHNIKMMQVQKIILHKTELGLHLTILMKTFCNTLISRETRETNRSQWRWLHWHTGIWDNIISRLQTDTAMQMLRRDQSVNSVSNIRILYSNVILTFTLCSTKKPWDPLFTLYKVCGIARSHNMFLIMY